MSFIADDFGIWLVGPPAEALRRTLAAWTLDAEKERALQQAAAATTAHDDHR
jgi:hypothetical protein